MPTLPKSTKLLVYEATIGDYQAKVIVDSGATTYYVSEQMAAKLGLKVTRTAPRRIWVADRDTTTVTGTVEFKMKLGNLPPETIKAYTFPLSKIDLVLGTT